MVCKPYTISTEWRCLLMKRALVIIVSLLFFLSFIGLTFIAEGGMGMQSWEQVQREIIKRVTGEVTAVDLKAQIITVKSGKGDVTVTCDDNTVVKMGNESKTLADIKVGDKVAVKYTRVDGKNIAKSVTINPEAGTATTEKK